MATATAPRHRRSFRGDASGQDQHQGLHLLTDAGMEVRHEAAMLLPALYIVLVAGEYEEMSQPGDQVVAWALGLAEDSPLIPVADVLLTAPQRGLDPDTTLGHLLSIPASTDSALEAQRRR